MPREQPGGLKASGHAAFLDQAEPELDHAVVLRPVDPRVLMANLQVVSQPRKGLFHELGTVVRPEALDAATDVRREFLRRRAHVGRALAPGRG